MNNDEIILLCAFRYAYGRRSYIVSTVKQYISKKLKKLSENFMELVLQEFEEFPLKECGGDECDIKQWSDLRDEIFVELERRNK